MTSQHDNNPTNIDIQQTADVVIAHLQRQDHAAALHALEQVRLAERTVVQEALDRYVAAGARPQLATLSSRDRSSISAEHMPALHRLQQALQPPRMPETIDLKNQPGELKDMSEPQIYDVYASIIMARGDPSAIDALNRQQSVILGLRRETSTLASMDENGQHGTGIYDDHLIVLRKDADGTKHTFITTRASTEPSAQYDQRATPGTAREETIYRDVAWRRIVGEDADGDGVADLGRLAEGTIEMSSTTHRNPASAGTRDSLRPSTAQLAPPRHAGRVERDSNGDGIFDHNDVNGVQDLNRTFKIHSGGLNNTYSAGCQTIHPTDYKEFINAATADKTQTSWQYVLTSTQEDSSRDHAPRDYHHVHPSIRGLFHDVHTDQCVSAVMDGDSDALDRLAEAFAHSEEGQRMAQLGQDLVAQQDMQRQASACAETMECAPE